MSHWWSRRSSHDDRTVFGPPREVRLMCWLTILGTEGFECQDCHLGVAISVATYNHVYEVPHWSWVPSELSYYQKNQWAQRLCHLCRTDSVTDLRAWSPFSEKGCQLWLLSEHPPCSCFPSEPSQKLVSRVMWLFKSTDSGICRGTYPRSSGIVASAAMFYAKFATW